MRKSNIVITALIVIVSLFLLWLWYYLGFNQIDSPLDLVISIVWWAVVVLGVVMVVRMEAARRRQIRTVYVRPGGFFNTEAGMIALGEGETMPEAVARALNKLEYGFGAVRAPEVDADGSHVVFDYVVRTKEYTPESSTQSEKWTGEVEEIRTGTVTEFGSRDELASAIG